MVIQINYSLYQCLAEVCTSHASSDYPILSLQQIFTPIALFFNNDNVNILLPLDAYNVDGIEEIDANNKTRIRITRDC